MRGETEQLADAQRAVIESLHGGQAAAPAFDALQMQRTAAMLRKKRAHTIAMVAPNLAAALGERFEPLFAEYAAKREIPAGGAGEDLRRFAHFLRGAHALPVAADAEILAILHRSPWRPIRVTLVASHVYVTLRLAGRLRIFKIM